MNDNSTVKERLTHPLIDLLNNSVESDIQSILEFIDYNRKKSKFLDIDFLCLTVDEIKALDCNMNFFEKKAIDHIYLYLNKPTTLSFKEFKYLLSKFNISTVVVNGLSRERSKYVIEPKTKRVKSNIWYKYLKNLEKLTMNLDESYLQKEKFLILCSRIAKKVKYNQESNNDFELDYANEIKGLVDDGCVCCGYSGILRDSCNSLGIEANVITGYNSLFGGHAWNQVNLDNNWYNVDLTWDLKSILNKEKTHWIFS